MYWKSYKLVSINCVPESPILQPPPSTLDILDEEEGEKIIAPSYKNGIYCPLFIWGGGWVEDCILVGIFASSPLFFRVSRLAVQKFGKMSVFSSFFFFIFSTSWSLHLPLPQLFYFWHGQIQQCLASKIGRNRHKKLLERMKSKRLIFLANSVLFFWGGESGNVTIIKSTRRERAEVTKKKRRRSGCHSSQKRSFPKT